MNKKCIWCFAAAVCILAGCESDDWKPLGLTDPPQCSPEACLSADGHEGWAKAECREDDSCKAVRCSNGYRLRDDNCLPILQCCGADCINCPESEGWIDGACKGGQCVAERCMDGYRLLPQKNGSVECRADASLACCGDACTNCAAGEGWKSGECIGGKCVADKCKTGYQLSPQEDGSVACEPNAGLACCGDACTNCAAGKGWKIGECIDGKCVAEQCNAGYQLSPQKDGSVACEPNAGLACCGDACTNCAAGEGWISGECIDGKCVAKKCDVGYQISPQKDGSSVCEYADVPPEDPCNGKICPVGQKCNQITGECVCSAGYSLCEDGCYNLKSDNTNCGECGIVCSESGFCEDGICKSGCEEGYIVSSYGFGCVEDGGPCTLPGEHKSEDDDNVVIYICNENYVWEPKRICHLLDNEGTGGVFYGDDDCTTICIDGYIQNADETNCDPISGPCTEGEFRCNDTWGKGEHLVCKDNKWDYVKVCKYDDHVEDMTCTPEDSCQLECTTGYKLNADGTECVFDTDETCTNGETRCGGMEFHRCKDNHWTVEEVCDLEGMHGGGAYCDDQTGCERWCFNGNVLCGKGCADLKKDYDNCGTCGNVCASGKCVNGVCK